MTNVGVIGLGMMGVTHLDVYASLPRARVVAVADRNADKRSGQRNTTGNIDGHAQGAFDLSQTTRYAEATDLIDDPDVQVVDICLPTDLHADVAVAALRAGKHVLIEKPMARTAAEAQRIINTAVDAAGFAMVAMCMRFWPGWDWLKQRIDDGAFGRLLGLSIERTSPHPGGPFYADAARSGAAILDLHLHDADFVQWCCGPPDAVRSVGYSHVTDGVDHVVTQYLYRNGPTVVAEAGWSMSPGYPFTMRYTANFEQATAVFDLAARQKLMLYQRGGESEPIDLDDRMGYHHELSYFLGCIETSQTPRRVTLAESQAAIALIEAEAKSVASGATVAVQRGSGRHLSPHGD